MGKELDHWKQAYREASGIDEREWRWFGCHARDSET